jgi:hypothetical protein
MGMGLDFGKPACHSQVEVVSADDDGVGHLGRVDDAGEDTATDRDVAGEGALLVDVGAVDGLCAVSAGQTGDATQTTPLLPLTTSRRSNGLCGCLIPG